MDYVPPVCLAATTYYVMSAIVAMVPRKSHTPCGRTSALQKSMGVPHGHVGMSSGLC